MSKYNLPVDEKIVGDYLNNAAFKETFQQLLILWQDKDVF